MSKLIKIAHITSAHPWEDIRIFHKECTSLAKNANFQVHLISGKGEDTVSNSVFVHSAAVKSKGGRVARMIDGVNAVYSKALEVKADIYHLHDPELLRIALKLKKTGAKVIYDAHEDLPRQILGKYWIPKIVRKTASFFFEKYENYVVRKLDGVITATGYIKDRFIKVNPFCVDVNNYPILSEDTVDEKIEEDYFCYAGGISNNRGVSTLVDAVALLPGFKLKLAGLYSPLSFRDELISKKGWNQVEELGYVNREEVKRLMKYSVAGMVTLKPLPNYLDSLPIKMFEYMYEGIPVIASDFPLWKTIIEDQGCGICVDPNSPKEIADAVSYLLDNPEKAKNMGKKGRELVLEKYNWKVEEHKLNQFYTKLLND